MASTFTQAQRGSRKALRTLYDGCKQDVYLLCRSLLGDDAQAAAATVTAFREVKPETVDSEAALRQAVLLRGAKVCYASATKRNPKALRLPAGRNFALAKTPDGQLPALHRFIFLCDAVGMTQQNIAGVLQLDSGAIQDCLSVQDTNFALLGTTAQQTLQALKAQASTLPSQVEQQLDNVAEAAIAPAAAQRKKHLTFVTAVTVVAVIIALTVGILAGTKLLEDRKNSIEMEELDPDITYMADIEIKGYGTVTVELDQSAAPITASNFVYLARKGFYNGLTFHRIKEGFMMQGGCPEGDGTGKATTSIRGEFTANGVDNPLSHTRGTISMARSGTATSGFNTGSCQFFIMHQDNTQLDGQYAAFGHVTEGMDIVDAICTSAEPINSQGLVAADKQPVITRITIREVA